MEIHDMLPEQEYHGHTMCGVFTYYRLIVEDTTRMLIITAEPADETSDPDLYVTTDDPTELQDSYIWKSANIGADKIEIHPEDKLYLPGIYYIGVLGYGSGVNNFIVKAYYEDTLDIVNMSKEWEGEIESITYFRFKIKCPGESRVEIIVKGGYGKVALFVSGCSYYPNAVDHQWSSGMLYWDKVVNETEDYSTDLDPYDDILQRCFTRKPTSDEVEKIAEMEQISTDLQSLSLEEKDLRFCIDTDEWKYSSKYCYVGVKNLTLNPLELSITRRELHEEEMISDILLERYILFKNVFDGIEGCSQSQSERQRLGVAEKSEFTYGEVEFVHFETLLLLASPKEGEVFWDLGCGAGKVLVSVALLYPDLSQVNGVEFLPGLHELCSGIVSQIEAPFPLPPINVVLGDMIEVDWSNADVIFTSSICFPNELISGMFEKTKLLKIGTRIITLKSFPKCRHLKMTYNLRVKMTWGKTGAYIYERINEADAEISSGSEEEVE